MRAEFGEQAKEQLAETLDIVTKAADTRLTAGIDLDSRHAIEDEADRLSAITHSRCLSDRASADAPYRDVRRPAFQDASAVQ
jgi:hypothetical protein